MIAMERIGGRLPWRAFASGIVACAFAASSGLADDGPAPPPVRSPKNVKPLKAPIGPGVGTLGYGPPGLHPGFQGFGLGYHLGYGYGGAALGVGATGGYPFYGGPGYPHPWPRLQRFGPIAPFCFFRGPGFPTPDHPNYYGPTGPLTPDQPVVTFEPDPLSPPYAAGYGQFDGTVPYAESAFAPYTTIAGAAGSASGVSTASPSSAPPLPSTDAAHPRARHGDLPAPGQDARAEDQHRRPRRPRRQGRPPRRRRDRIDQRLCHAEAARTVLDRRECREGQGPQDDRATDGRGQGARGHRPAPVIRPGSASGTACFSYHHYRIASAPRVTPYWPVALSSLQSFFASRRPAIASR